jgi:LPS-assembly lipoprotein
VSTLLKKMVLAVKLRTSSIFKNTVILSLLITLLGCGYALRSKVPLSPQLAKIFIETGGNQSRVLSALRIALLQQEVSVTKNRNEAIATFNIVKEEYDRQVLTVSSSGKVEEFVLSLLFEFSVENKLGVMLIKPTQVKVERDLRFNISSVTASSSEEEQRIKDMVQDVVRQIILRLQHSTGP